MNQLKRSLKWNKGEVFLLFIFIFGIGGCSEDSLYWGESTALKNGTQWDAEIYGSENNSNSSLVDITLNVLQDGRVKENLFLYNIPYELGDYTLVNDTIQSGNSNVFYSTSTRDGLADIYAVIEHDSIEDFVEIAEISNKGVIEGKFQISLVKDLSWGDFDSTAPYTIEFLNGSFRTKVID